MSRMLDALKQMEARSGAPRTDHGEHPGIQEGTAEPSNPADRVESTVERIEQAISEERSAEPIGQAPEPPAGPAPAAADRPAIAPALVEPAATLMGRRFSDRAAGGDWLAEIGGCDLRPGSRLGSQYRRLRDRILAQLPRGASSSLLVASAERESGATAVAIGLGAVLAEVSSGDVLIVDADLGRSDLARRVGIDAAAGLTDILSGAANWQESVVRIPPGCVQILAAGRSVVSASAGSFDRLAALLDELKRRYRAILIDAGVADLAAARHWPGVCDATYLCLDLDETSAHRAVEAASLLRRSGGRLLGCIAVRAGHAY